MRLPETGADWDNDLTESLSQPLASAKGQKQPLECDSTKLMGQALIDILQASPCQDIEIFLTPSVPPLVLDYAKAASADLTPEQKRQATKLTALLKEQHGAKGD